MKDTDERTTPDVLFNLLNSIFDFTLDPASTHENHKCPKYYTIQEDGLVQSWAHEKVFVNPPFSRGEIIQWLMKASYESKSVHQDALVVMLTPADTSTKWFQYIWKQSQYIYFPARRFAFGGVKFGAKFSNAISIWGCPSLYGINEGGELDHPFLIERLESLFGGKAFML